LPNTRPVSPTPTDLSKIERSAVPTKLDETAASLERLLQAERDNRNQERFFWIFGLSILSDVVIFKALDHWAYSIPIFLLQVIFLIGLAAWMGVDTVSVFLERLFYAYFPGKKDDQSDGK
jgi:hypothetical protein